MEKMPGGMRGQRDKEMLAVTHNLLEQRVLEKSLQTLNLEQSYSMKILELDSRVIKVHYKKLKDRVSKIKSHLPVEDISKFRYLDLKGKLRPSYVGASVTNAIKIAAASRMLNLTNGRSYNARLAHSAMPRISVQHDLECKSNSSVSVNKSSMSDNSQKHDKTQRPDIQQSSASLLQPLISIGKEQCEKVTITEVDATGQDGLAVSTVKSEVVAGRRSGAVVRASTAVVSHRSHAPFSSHSAAEKNARRRLSTAPSHYNRIRRSSHASRDSIESHLGEDLQEERRLELLDEEIARADTLSKKTKLFLQEVDRYLQKNPRVAFENYIPDAVRSDYFSDSNTSSGLTAGQLQRRSHQETEFDETPTYLPELKYKERLLMLWKDMNKCRYLRIPDDKIDLSGINTLVKDHMKLFDVLRQAEKQAWEI